MSRPIGPTGRLLVFCASWTAASAGAAGIAMTLSARDPLGEAPRASSSVELSVDIRDGDSGYPLRGLHPSAWLRPRPGEGETSPDACREAASSYSGKGVLPPGVTDLNGFTLVTLSDDHSLSVADPELDLATANLLLVAPLGEPVLDLEIDHAAAAAYVTHPDGLSRVDLEDGRRVRLPLAERPGSILRDAETGALWLGLDGTGAVTRIGGHGVAPARSESGDLAVGPGPLALELDVENSRLFALASDGRVTAVATAGARRLWQAAVGQGADGLAYSALADTLYVSRGRALIPIYADSGRRGEPIGLPAGGQDLAVTADGRRLLALDREAGMVTIVDLARGRATQALKFVNEPDQIALTDDYAYVHHRAAPMVSLIALDSLETGREAAVIDVPFGTAAPGETRPEDDLVAAIPHGGGAVVVSPADRMAFVYMEDGMQAPMNAFLLRAGQPRRISVRDRRLQELGDGRYVTTAKVGGAGRYELVVALAEPPVVSCLAFDLSGGGRDRVQSAKSAPVAVSLGEASATESGVRVRLADAATGEGVSGVADLQFLVMSADGRWHRRGFARPMAAGEYALDVRLPRAGRYRVLLRSRSLALTFEQTGGLYATLEK